MIDISKFVERTDLTELDRKVLYYIIENIDTVLQQGVRDVAKENYTSPATVIRLAQKMGYTGFVDLYYNLLPLVKNVDSPKETDSNDFFKINQQDFFQYNTLEDIDTCIKQAFQLNKKYIFIYAAGFSAIAAEYLHKKCLLLGKKAILATPSDSVGLFENNMEDIGVFFAISKSGETQSVINKINSAKEHGIFVVSFTKETKNRVASLSDLNFRIEDSHKLDDRNMLPNTFFPRLLLFFEFILKKHLDDSRHTK